MNEHTAPAAARRVVLLVKSQKFAHQAGYFLSGGRWHAIKHDKPAPKNAPVASHPHAAGQHAPVVLTDEQVAQLKYPEDKAAANKEMAAHNNVHLPKLLEHAANGDATAILGTGFGTNSHSKKKALAANVLLGMMGSKHKVEIGQAPGSHPAVKQAPSAGEPAAEAPAKTEENPKLDPVGQALKEAVSKPEPFKPTLDQVMALHGKPIDEVKATMKKWAEKVGGHDKLGALLMEYKQQAVEHAKPKAAPAKAATPKPAEPVPTFNVGDTVPGKQLRTLKPGSVVQLFHDGKPWRRALIGHNSVWFSKQNGDQGWQKNSLKPQQVTSFKMGQYGDGQLLSEGGDDWMPDAQKTMAVQVLATKQAKHSDAKAYRMGGALVVGEIGKPFSFVWVDEDGKWGAGFHGSQEKKLSSGEGLAPVNLGGQPAVEAGQSDGDPKQKGETTQAEQATSLAMPAFVEGKTTQGVTAYYEKQAQKILDLAAAGDAAGLEKLKADGLKPNSKGKVGNTYKGKTENSKLLLELHAQALQQVGGAPAAQAEKPAEPKPELTPKAEKPPAPAPAPEPAGQPTATTSKLSQIPWDSQLLPDSNTNAKSHNGKVAQIKAMAEAGDLAGLEAFKAGKNTYGQKQMKLAALAIAALKEDAAAPAPTEPAKPAEQPVPEPAAAAPAEEGPNEGDTKEGADGTLVFHNGRWHKQEQPQAAEQHPIDAVRMPALTFSNPSSNQKVAAALEKLKEQIKAEGPSALKGVTKHMKSKGKYIVTLPGVYGALKVYGYEHSPDHAGSKVHAYVEALKAAVGKPSKKAAQKKATGPAIGANGIESMDGWKQTGPQGGSNPGGKFKDQNGTEWYCKFPADEDVAKSEVLAAQLYAIAGVAGQDAKLVTKDGKLGIASKWTTVSKASPADLAKTPGVLAGFATDAWLGNWDVVGMAYDNLQVNEKGQAVRVDAGGSLTYRAQGGKKAFGTTVIELDSLCDAKINPQAAAVFGKMTQADITASVAKVLAIPDSAIINAVEIHGPGDASSKKALADVLLARKADLAAKFPKAVKPPKKRLNPDNLPVKEDRLPKAHDFNNWLGQGKPLSSQPHVNAANMAVEQEMLALAKTGNLTKLKDFKFHAIDKATGSATGQLIPIAQHPSKHVVQLHADLVQVLDEIANPPEPLKVFHETDVGTVEQLAAALPPKKFGTTVNAVKSNEKLGFWVVLGTAHGAQKFKPSKVMDYGTEAIKAGYEKYKQASSLAKHFIKSVQASGSYNDLFRSGKETDGAGHKLADVAKAALEHATTMPEGTSLYRWQNIPDDMVKKIMAAPDGTVFQATGPMCTSYHPTATSGFGPHRVTIRYAKGAKAVESFGSGGFAGEKEVTTLPNSRFVVLSKQMVPNEKNPGKQRLELEVLMLPPDLGL